jgi:hypothetical protein
MALEGAMVLFFSGQCTVRALDRGEAQFTSEPGLELLVASQLRVGREASLVLGGFATDGSAVH